MRDQGKSFLLAYYAITIFGLSREALAQPSPCLPNQPYQSVSQVEVLFENSNIPQSLIPRNLKLVSGKRTFEVTRVSEGIWRTPDDQKERGFQPIKTEMKISLAVKGYSILPAFGEAEDRPNDKCYGVYRFTPDKITWTLVASPDPKAQFRYRIANKTETREGAGTVIIKDHLATNARMEIQVFEFVDAIPRCLFTLRDFRYDKLQKEGSWSAERIGEKIYEDRKKYVNLGGQYDFLCVPDDQDRYNAHIERAEKAQAKRRRTASEQELELLDRRVMLELADLLKLRSVEFRDATERLK